MDLEEIIQEAKALARGEKGRVWVPGYTRADGTHVDGYYRFEGRIGATAFRPEDVNKFDDFYASAKGRAFEKSLEPTAKKHGVTLDSVEHVAGFWEGEMEPSWAIEAHDGEEGVKNFSEEIRGSYDQDAVLNFDYDEDGTDVMYEIEGKADWPRMLDLHKIQGATIYPNKVEIIGDDKLAKTVARMASESNATVSATRGSLSLVDRV